MEELGAAGETFAMTDAIDLTKAKMSLVSQVSDQVEQ